MKIISGILVFAVIVFSCSFSIAEENQKKKTSYFDENWLKSVVSLEIIGENGNESSIGTGFIVASPNKHLLLVTARHVVLNKKGSIVNELAIRLMWLHYTGHTN